MIDQMYLMLYNLVFTGLPPLVIGVYDKTIAEDLLFTKPYLYKYVSKSWFRNVTQILQTNIYVQICQRLQSRMGRGYKAYSFWLNMLDSVYQSLVIFFVAKAAYADSTVDIWEFGTTITTSCLYTMLVHGAIEIKSWVRSSGKKETYSALWTVASEKGLRWG